ncbi:MAG: GlsB/YeaQ/YmgE family stress response membrane protein [Tepidiformaceae bacterium]
MGWLAWLVLGLIAGLLAKLVVPTSAGGGGCTGLIVTIVIGIAGAAIGGFIGVRLGWGEVDEFDLRSVGLAFLGAVILLLGLRVFRLGRS